MENFITPKRSHNQMFKENLRRFQMKLGNLKYRIFNFREIKQMKRDLEGLRLTKKSND